MAKRRIGIVGYGHLGELKIFLVTSKKLAVFRFAKSNYSKYVIPRISWLLDSIIQHFDSIEITLAHNIHFSAF